MAEKNYTCRRCGVDKKRAAFGTLNGSIRPYCKMCRANYERDRRAANPQQFRDAERLRRLNSIETYRERDRRTGAARRTPEYLKEYRERETQRLRDAHVLAAVITSCADCEIQFCNLFGRHSWITRCPERRADREKERRRVKNSAYRARRRSTKAENIDPIKVFERDRWRCHLCGVKTIKSLRGTYEPRAPELEHIVPLSQGGTHSWGNVACSCRACNAAKGAAALGQIGLDLAVYGGGG